MLILDLWGISFHAVVVFGLGKNLLFKSILGRCDWLLTQFRGLFVLLLHEFFFFFDFGKRLNGHCFIYPQFSFFSKCKSKSELMLGGGKGVPKWSFTPAGNRHFHSRLLTTKIRTLFLICRQIGILEIKKVLY